MDILYTIFIFPLEYSMRLILDSVAPVIGVGNGIVILSIVVNIVLLPLYGWAEKIQNKERAIQFSMYPAVLEVKQKYRGEEQFYKLKAIYEKNKYHPIKGMRTIFGFAIQVPFFISAFIMLQNYPPLQNQAFLFVSDLNAPDGLLWGVNLLPFVMTAVNIVSSMVYTDTLTKQEKNQLWAMAGLFLILLYNAPAGLVLYWTVNNLFSYGKNIVYAKKTAHKTAKARMA